MSSQERRRKILLAAEAIAQIFEHAELGEVFSPGLTGKKALETLAKAHDICDCDDLMFGTAFDIAANGGSIPNTSDGVSVGGARLAFLCAFSILDNASMNEDSAQSTREEQMSLVRFFFRTAKRGARKA